MTDTIQNWNKAIKDRVRFSCNEGAYLDLESMDELSMVGNASHLIVGTVVEVIGVHVDKPPRFTVNLIERSFAPVQTAVDRAMSMVAEYARERDSLLSYAGSLNVDAELFPDPKNLTACLRAMLWVKPTAVVFQTFVEIRHPTSKEVMFKSRPCFSIERI